jgi:hypothetical protein
MDALRPMGLSCCGRTPATDYLAGQPAVTGHAFGAGDTLYSGAHADGRGVATRTGLRLLRRQSMPGVRLSTRRSRDREVMFLTNHSDQPHMLRLEGEGTHASTGEPLSGEVTLPARAGQALVEPTEPARPGSAR